MFRLLILVCFLIFYFSLQAQTEYTSYYSEGGKEYVITEYNADLQHIIKYHKNGSIKEKGYIQDGKFHGKWTCWNDKGKKTMIAKFDRGVRDGKWIIFDEKAQYYHVYFDDNRKRLAHQFNHAGHLQASR